MNEEEQRLKKEHPIAWAVGWAIAWFIIFVVPAIALLGIAYVISHR